MVRLQVLQAADGDSMILTYCLNSEKHEIWIDSGRKITCYQKLKNQLQKLKEHEQKVDLLVLTHRDEDHIVNAKRLFSEKKLNRYLLREVWYHFGEEQEFLDVESEKISYQQAEKLNDFLINEKIRRPGKVIAGMELERAGASYTILCPDENELSNLFQYDKECKENTNKINGLAGNIGTVEELAAKPYEEDDSVTNRASISFLWTLGETKILFLGDAPSSVLQASLNRLGYDASNPLHVDLCKIPHHASAYNTSNEFLQCISCNRYIISTSCVNDRPSKEALSRIIVHTKGQVTFLHNYEINWTSFFTPDEFERYEMKFQLIPENGLWLKDGLCQIIGNQNTINCV